LESVVVTGVGGYIAKYVAAELLQSGYAVTGTVRSIKRADGIKSAVGVQADTSNLSFAEADLLADAGWKELMDGADYVMHVASPFTLDEPRDENELIAPAVEGTQRVLCAAEEAGVQRVVVTSSVLTLFMGRGSGYYGPDSWSDVNAKIGAYAKSKTLAEQKAWQLAESMKTQVSTVLPGYVIGPAIDGIPEGASASTISDMINGKLPGIPDLWIPMVDVRDVARLHVAAMESPEAAGKRLIGSQPEPTAMGYLAETLKAAGYTKVPGRKLPTGLVKFLGIFNKDARSMVPYVGFRPSLDTSLPNEVCNWTAGSIDSGLLEMSHQLIHNSR
jgi:dihydroflavonol-4-reductase